MWHYLGQGYTNNPQGEEAAFQFALKVCYILEHELGVKVISPIRQSHPQWQYIKKNNHPHPPHEFWMSRDLALCKALLVKQSKYDKDSEKFVRITDIGLTMLFAENCFYPCEYIDGKYCFDWLSKGAEIEYDWAKDNYVRCLLLEPFLKGKEVEF